MVRTTFLNTFENIIIGKNKDMNTTFYIMDRQVYILLMIVEGATEKV